MTLNLWRRLNARHTRSVGQERSRLETDLRLYYASTIEQGWNHDTEDRVHARVARAIAAQRLESRASGGTFRLKRLAGPHVAAIVCAGAAVFAFGGMIDVGRGGSQAQIQPTSSPLTGQPARSTGNAKLSLVSIQPPSNVEMAV